jgi:hypothetical protein
MKSLIILSILSIACIHTEKPPLQQSKECQDHIISKAVDHPDGIQFKLGYHSCQNSAPYSILLRSTSDKSLWENVSPEEDLKEASHLYFVSPQVGFLVLSHFVEGPGEEKLYKTLDQGKSWKYINIIPKHKPWHLHTIAKVCFIDEKKATFKIYKMGSPRLTNLTTYDGGASFTKSEDDFCLNR